MSKLCELLIKSTSKSALVCPSQGVRWSGAELSSRVGGFATQLQKLGYKNGDAVGMVLTNRAENAVVQLAAAISGLSVVTAKTAADLQPRVAKLRCKGVVLGSKEEMKVFSSSSMSHSPILATTFSSTPSTAATTTADLTVDSLSSQGSTDQCKNFLSVAGEGEKFAYYNSDTPTPLSTLLALGEATVNRLKLTESDVVCVPVTLNHSMGFGFGVLSALSAGSTLLLPVGVLGFGAQSPFSTSSTLLSPALTLEALRQEKVSVLLADTHTLNDLKGVTEEFKDLRIGLTKIGSGEAFDLAPAPQWAGIDFVTVGKPPAKK